MFNVTIIPGAGHGLNLEYDHPTTYASVLNFLLQNGCGPSSSTTNSTSTGSYGGSTSTSTGSSWPSSK